MRWKRKEERREKKRRKSRSEKKREKGFFQMTKKCKITIIV